MEQKKIGRMVAPGRGLKAHPFAERLYVQVNPSIQSGIDQLTQP